MSQENIPRKCLHVSSFASLFSITKTSSTRILMCCFFLFAGQHERSRNSRHSFQPFKSYRNRLFWSSLSRRIKSNGKEQKTKLKKHFAAFVTDDRSLFSGSEHWISHTPFRRGKKKYFLSDVTGENGDLIFFYLFLRGSCHTFLFDFLYFLEFNNPDDVIPFRTGKPTGNPNMICRRKIYHC